MKTFQVSVMQLCPSKLVIFNLITIKNKHIHTDTQRISKTNTNNWTLQFHITNSSSQMQ